MAESKGPNNNDFVDISSKTAVFKALHPESAERQKKAKKRSKVSFALRVTSLVLAIIFLLGGGIVLYAYSRKPKYKAVDDAGDQLVIRKDASADEASGDEPDGVDKFSYTLVQGDGVLLEHESVLNILLFGSDSRNPKDHYGLSDTIILLSLDALHKKIKLTSFQRDTYVYIPGYGDDKINAAYSIDGEGLAIQTVEANFGIKVDRYATVDFDSFRKIIRILGGVDMELDIEEIKYINAQIDVNNQLGKTSFIEYDPDKKTQTIHLDGYQALWYARDRGEENLGGNPEYSFDGDDWDRTQRQRKLVETILKDLRTEASLTDLIQIVNDVGPLITTNLKTSEIIFLARNIMTFLNYDMVQMTLPSDGTWRYGHTDDGQSVIVIDDWAKARYDMASFIYEDAITLTEKKQ